MKKGDTKQPEKLINPALFFCLFLRADPAQHAASQHSGTFKPNFFQISTSYTRFELHYSSSPRNCRDLKRSKIEGKFEFVWLMRWYSTRCVHNWKTLFKSWWITAHQSWGFNFLMHFCFFETPAIPGWIPKKIFSFHYSEIKIFW